MVRRRSRRPYAFMALGLGLPAVLWLLVPKPGELQAVSLRAQAAPGGPISAFELASTAGIARLEAILAVAPDRLDWRRSLATALEDAGRTSEELAQWRLIAADPQASDADVRLAARELIGHHAQAEGLAVLDGLAAKHALAPAELRDAAEQAGGAALWPQAAHFLELLALATPNDPWPLATLARLQERRGDLDAAVAAWQRRLALPDASAYERLAVVSLLQREGRQAEALQLLEDAGPGVSLAEWRERASLAWGLGEAAKERAARQALAHLAPNDRANRLALADRLGADGDAAGANQLYLRVRAAADDDPDTLAELASRWVDGDPRRAAPILARLAAFPDPPDAALRVLARAWRKRDPARAAAWLRTLAARGGDNALDNLLQGDLEARLGHASAAAAAWQLTVARVPAGVTDRVFLHARERAASKLTTWSRGVLPDSPSGLLTTVHSWAVYYGPVPSPLPVGRLQAPDLLVLEPDQHWQPKLFRRAGQHVLAYLSLGEVQKSRPYYAALAMRQGVVLGPNPSWPEAIAVDPRSPAWWGLVLESIVPQILAQGYDGLFLDTLDDGPALETDPRFKGAGKAMGGLVEALRGHFPGALLLGNGGLALLPQTAAALDGLALESIFTDYHFSPPGYHLRPPTLAAARAKDVAGRLQGTGLPLFLIEYVDPTDPIRAAGVSKQVQAHGWVPFVAPIGLDQLP